MQGFPVEVALENLKGNVPPDVRGYLCKEEAYEMLRELSGKAFPIEDIQAWTEWVRKEMESYPSKFAPPVKRRG